MKPDSSEEEGLALQLLTQISTGSQAHEGGILEIFWTFQTEQMISGDD